MNKHDIVKIAKVESALLYGARNYFASNGFSEVLPPHISKGTGACENVDTLFGVDFFGQKAYLAQTGQLYLEALLPSLKKVWCVGPSFRAEPVADNRHLVEFPLIEMEFEGDFNQLLVNIEEMIIFMIKEVPYLEGRNILIKRPFPRIEYKDAIDILGLEWGTDLKANHEQELIMRNGVTPIFITHFPKSIKFFNMRENDDDPEIVNSADLILPFAGEAVGSAEREHRYDKLVERLETSPMLRRLEEKGGSIRDFDWYLNIVKNGVNLHSGCGVGFNRVTQWILAENDIRNCTAFPLNSETLI
jgi:asparaginyl-tRNA synthetase